MRTQFFDLPLRFQIMIPFSVLIIALAAGVVGVGLPLTKRTAAENLDLRMDSSAATFLRRLEEEANSLDETASRMARAPALEEAIASGDKERVSDVLEGARGDGLDAVQVVDPAGVNLGAAGGRLPLEPPSVPPLAAAGTRIVPSSTGQMLASVQPIGPPEDPVGFLATGRLLERLLAGLKPSSRVQLSVYQNGALAATTFESDHGRSPEVSSLPPEFTDSSGVVKRGSVIGGHGYGTVYDLLPLGENAAFAVFVPKSQVWPGDALFAVALAVALGVPLVLLVLGFAIARAIAARLERVVRVIEVIGSGNFQKRVNLASNDEVGRLAQVVNAMAGRLQEAETSKAEFLGMASHELKTPLALIDNATELLMEQPPEPEVRRELLQIISGNVERMKRRVLDLLDLARLEAGHLTLHRRPIDLLPLVSEVAEDIRPMLAPKELSLSLELPATLPEVDADPDRIQQVLLNFLSNAARHTSPGAHIWVRARQNGHGVIVEVEDDGPGLPEAKLRRLLDTGRRAFAGDGGLGLLIAQRLIALHNGHIWGRSESGKGALFAFALPAKRGDRE